MDDGCRAGLLDYGWPSNLVAGEQLSAAVNWVNDPRGAMGLVGLALSLSRPRNIRRAPADSGQAGARQQTDRSKPKGDQFGHIFHFMAVLALMLLIEIMPERIQIRHVQLGRWQWHIHGMFLALIAEVGRELVSAAFGFESIFSQG